MFISRTSARFACGLLLGWCVGTARADYLAGNYTGSYNWLSFFHTSITQSATYWNGPPTEGWGWLSAYGLANDANTMDRWRQITWDRDVTLTGVRLQAFHQRTGGSIGNYNVQYSADGTTGWTDVPTATVFNGTSAYNASFTSSVTARGLRVSFPAGTYNMGTGGFGGPGLYSLLAHGSVPSGIDPTDPQFDIVAAGGIPGVTPVASLPSGGRALTQGNTAIWTNNYFDGDGDRAGWYPAMLGNEALVLDLGANNGHPFKIQNIRLYGGTFYVYLPSSMDAYVSYDNVSWSLLGTMSVVNNVLRLDGLSAMGRYLKLANPPLASSYILPQEIAVSAYPMPEPGSALLLCLAAALGWRRRCRCASSRTS